MEYVRRGSRGRRRFSSGFALAVSLAVAGFCLVAGARTATAQAPRNGSLVRGVPQIPPNGAWAEIIHATPRWLVVQNYTGQQFPIAVENIADFLVRWPATLDDVGPTALVEAIGPDLGSNVIQTNHIDFYDGADRGLVAPTYNSILPNGRSVTAVDPGFVRLMNGWDYAGQNMLYGWAFPVSPMLTGIPSRLHVVGTLVNEIPVRLSAPGNVVATIAPAESEVLKVTQVTRGTADQARKGDVAFLKPVQVTPRGLVVSQLVLYKTIPFRRFEPQR